MIWYVISRSNSTRLVFKLPEVKFLVVDNATGKFLHVHVLQIALLNSLSLHESGSALETKSKSQC